MVFIIDHTKKLELQELEKFLADENAEVKIADPTKEIIQKGRTYLEQKLKSSQAPIYGINTGFGSLCNVIIPDDELEQLQENLVKSHACGAGDQVPDAIVKIMLYLKIRSLSYGKSGVKLETVDLLCQLLNNKIFPVILQQGSLGASGDLAPLAHMSLV